MSIKQSTLESGMRSILGVLDPHPEREGLVETPGRYARAMLELTKGYGEDPAGVLKVFEDGAEGCDQMVLQRDIPVKSLCEHHLLPFFGLAHVAYIPDQKIVGLSKLARVVDIFARRFQVQERLTNQVADLLFKELKPKGVGVVLECRHLCMEYRGIQAQGTITTTSALRGCIKDEDSARAEFLQFIHAR